MTPYALIRQAAQAADDRELTKLCNRAHEAERQAIELEEAAREAQAALDGGDTTMRMTAREQLRAGEPVDLVKATKEAMMLEHRARAAQATAQEARAHASELRQAIDAHVNEHGEQLREPLIASAKRAHSHLASQAAALRAEYEAYEAQLRQVYAAQPTPVPGSRVEPSMLLRVDTSHGMTRSFDTLNPGTVFSELDRLVSWTRAPSEDLFAWAREHGRPLSPSDTLDDDARRRADVDRQAQQESHKAFMERKAHRLARHAAQEARLNAAGNVQAPESPQGDGAPSDEGATPETAQDVNA